MPGSECSIRPPTCCCNICFSCHSYLQGCILDFLKLMSDPDRHVRRAAVVALSAVAYNKPQLVAGHLPTLLPMLYDQTHIKEDMIRTVDLGPFKHKVGQCTNNGGG